MPLHLVPDFDNLSNGSVEPVWSNRFRTCTKNGQTIDNSRYDRFDLEPKLVSWVQDHIANDYKNIGLSYMWGESINLPHTDHTRDVTLLYLFDTGGPAVETRFWQRRGFSLHYENADPSYTYNPDQPTTYDDLDLIFSIVLKPYQWYVLDARTIHSVEGMISPRISLQLGFLKQSSWAQRIFDI